MMCVTTPSTLTINERIVFAMAITHLTIPHLPTKDITRVFSKIRISKTSTYQNIPCWEWTQGFTPDGYGFIKWQRRTMHIHRFMYAWLIGPVPDYNKTGLVIDHLCDNRKCVNPAHLRLTTNRINVLRGNGVAAQNSRRTHCKNGHLLVLDHKRSRACKTCAKEFSRKHKRTPEYKAYIREYNKRYYAKKRGT